MPDCAIAIGLMSGAQPGFHLLSASTSHESGNPDVDLLQPCSTYPTNRSEVEANRSGAAEGFFRKDFKNDHHSGIFFPLQGISIIPLFFLII